MSNNYSRRTVAQRREELKDTKQNGFNQNVYIGGLVFLLVMIALFILLFPNSGEQNSAEAIDQTLTWLGDNSVSELIELEPGEPLVATVVDVAEMQNLDPEFFEDVKLDDQIIVLNNKRIIILYRPSEDKIINISSGVLAVTNN